MSRLGWIQKRPTSKGLYLRSDPPDTMIIVHEVVETNGVLKTHMDGQLLPLAQTPGRFWWLGPLPECPWKFV
jgi:hypothetical protein